MKESKRDESGFSLQAGISMAALIYAALLIVLLYDRWLVFLDFLNFFFSSVPVLLGSLLIGFALGIFALLRGRRRPVVTACLVIGLVAVGAFPVLLPALYEPYSPAADSAPGCDMLWLTKPADQWHSAFRNAQRLHEKTGCTYALYGWTPESVLYYTSGCHSGYWRFDPLVDAEPQLVTRAPENIVTSIDRGNRGAGGMHIYPSVSELGYPYQYDFIVTEKAQSPDGRWTAVVVGHYYGPQDVMVLTPEGAVRQLLQAVCG